MEFYKRKYKLEFFLNDSPMFEIDNIESTRLTKFLRVVFNFNIVATGESGSGNIEVYNLNEEHRDQLKIPFFAFTLAKAQSEGIDKITVKLSAGYEGFIDELFHGAIVWGRSVYESPNWVTRLKVIPLIGNDIRPPVINELRAKGDSSKIKAIVQAIGDKGIPIEGSVDSAISSIDAEIQDQKEVQESARKNKSDTLKGNTATLLKSALSGTNAISWFDPVSGSFNLKTIGNPPANPTEINDTNGIVGIPDIQKTSIDFDFLISPVIKIGEYYNMKLKSFEGGVQVMRMTVDGDSHGENWTYRVTSLRNDFNFQ